MNGLIKLVITLPFLDKVKYLCSKVPEKEWSGMLFYDIQGTIKDISKMVITPTEILIKDIGTKASTAFEYDEQCLEFIEENNLLMSKHGMVHSHNTMPVFFSGTDIEELQDNVENHNIYLSLVVNNFMAMVAKVVFIGKPTSTFDCKDENGEDYQISTVETEPIMLVIDCDIQLPIEHIKVSDTFKKVFSVVKKKTSERDQKISQNANAVKLGNKGSATGANGYNSWGKSSGYMQDFNSDSEQDFDFQNRLGAIEDIEPEEEDEFRFDDFFAYCFKGGSHTLEDINDLVADTNPEVASIIIDTIITNYAIYYENYFETNEFGLDAEEFKNCLDAFIAMCDYCEEANPWIKELRLGLKLILSKFSQLNLNRNDAKI